MAPLGMALAHSRCAPVCSRARRVNSRGQAVGGPAEFASGNTTPTASSKVPSPSGASVHDLPSPGATRRHLPSDLRKDVANCDSRSRWRHRRHHHLSWSQHAIARAARGVRSSASAVGAIIRDQRSGRQRRHDDEIFAGLGRPFERPGELALVVKIRKDSKRLPCAARRECVSLTGRMSKPSHSGMRLDKSGSPRPFA